MHKKAHLPLRLLLPWLALAASACAATPATPVKGPETPPTPPAQAAPPNPAAFTVDGPVREESFSLLKPAAVDPAKAQLLPPPPGLGPVPANLVAQRVQ